MTPPFRQIRAHYDEETITVYQAYNSTIAAAAVAEQKLNASPQFRTRRMTWIKPSWAWMLYRAGYSYKDAGQERILALKMKHGDFFGILERAVLTTHDLLPNNTDAQEDPSPEGTSTEKATKRSPGRTRQGGGKVKEKSADVKVQWDPERSIRLERLEYRSIQIGIPAAIGEDWVANMIVSIEDVTDRARSLKQLLDEKPEITDAELLELGLAPRERPFEVSEQLRVSLKMNE